MNRTHVAHFESDARNSAGSVKIFMIDIKTPCKGNLYQPSY
jgi:hypothetical protein